MSGSLHPGLREPWASCESVRRELLGVLGRVPPGDWLAAGAGGGWSIAQQASHLLLSETGTSKMVRRLIRGDFKDLSRPAGATLHDSTLSAYPFGPATAPAFLEPQILAADEALRRLAESHGRFFEELQRFQADDPDVLASPDPASDFWFTLGGWVRVQALHEAHHLEQIRKIRVP